jgi:hypothetical protein
MPRPSHSEGKPGAEEEFKQGLCEKLGALGLEAGSTVKVWMMDEARFGLHTEMRRVWTLRGRRPVVARQIKYEWDYLYGALSVIGGEAHFAHLPGVSLEWDETSLRDGDPRLPARVRIIDLPPYTPELNPCEQLWDIVKDDIANRIHATVTKLRAGMRPTLQRFWEAPRAVLSLFGRQWLQVELSASHGIEVSC